MRAGRAKPAARVRVMRVTAAISPLLLQRMPSASHHVQDGAFGFMQRTFSLHHKPTVTVVRGVMQCAVRMCAQGIRPSTQAAREGGLEQLQQEVGFEFRATGGPAPRVEGCCLVTLRVISKPSTCCPLLPRLQHKPLTPPEPLPAGALTALGEKAYWVPDEPLSLLGGCTCTRLGGMKAPPPSTPSPSSHTHKPALTAAAAACLSRPMRHPPPACAPAPADQECRPAQQRRCLLLPRCPARCSALRPRCTCLPPAPAPAIRSAGPRSKGAACPSHAAPACPLPTPSLHLPALCPRPASNAPPLALCRCPNRPGHALHTPAREGQRL